MVSWGSCGGCDCHRCIWQTGGFLQVLFSTFFRMHLGIQCGESMFYNHAAAACTAWCSSSSIHHVHPPPQPGVHGSYARRYHECTLLPCGAPKLVALGEIDAVPCLDTCAADMAPWAWFCVWSGHFAADGVHNTPEVLRKAYSHPSAVSLQQLTAWRAQIE